MKKSALRASLILAAVAFARLACAQGGLEITGAAKATPKAGVHYTVELVRDGVHQAVSPNFPFKTGDRVSLKVRSDFDAYVYVLNRTMTGDPEALATRSMALVAEDDVHNRPSECPYDLVYPVAGEQLKLKAGVAQSVPPRGQTMQMNDPPGVEKLLLIVSPHPENDIMAMFASKNGCLNRPAGTAPAAGGGTKTDSDTDVLNRFNKRVLDMEQNVEERDFVTVSHPQTGQVTPPQPPAPTAPPSAAPPVVSPAPPAPGKVPTLQPPGLPQPVVVHPKIPTQPMTVEISLKHQGAA